MSTLYVYKAFSFVQHVYVVNNLIKLKISALYNIHLQNVYCEQTVDQPFQNVFAVF